MKITDDRNEMRLALKGRCADFLNFEKGGEVSGEQITGFYIELEDILDILYGEDE